MKKKKKNPFLIFITILFGIYIGMYTLLKGGYYQYKEYNKMVLTKEAMDKFESDISEGKDVTLSDYITNNTENYQNKVSKLGYNTSKFFENFFNEGLSNIFKVLGKLFVS